MSNFIAKPIDGYQCKGCDRCFSKEKFAKQHQTRGKAKDLCFGCAIVKITIVQDGMRNGQAHYVVFDPDSHTRAEDVVAAFATSENVCSTSPHLQEHVVTNTLYGPSFLGWDLKSVEDEALGFAKLWVNRESVWKAVVRKDFWPLLEHNILLSGNSLRRQAVMASTSDIGSVSFSMLNATLKPQAVEHRQKILAQMICFIFDDKKLYPQQQQQDASTVIWETMFQGSTTYLSLFLHYLAIMGSNKGTFASCSALHTLCLHLLWLLRAFVVAIDGESFPLGQRVYSECIESTYVQWDKETPIRLIQHTIKILDAFQVSHKGGSSTLGTPRLLHVADQVVILDGHCVPIDVFSVAFTQLKQHCISLMHNMCDKVAINDDNALLSVFGPQCTHDNMRNVKFTNMNGVPWTLVNEDSIVRELLHESMVPRFITSSSSSNKNTASSNDRMMMMMETLLSQLVQLEHYLYALMHVSGGGLPRATSYVECMHHAFSALDPHYSRTLFFPHKIGMVSLLVPVKLVSAFGSQLPVARFYPPIVSALMVLYLKVFRPFHEMLVCCYQGSKTTTTSNMGGGPWLKDEGYIGKVRHASWQHFFLDWDTLKSMDSRRLRLCISQCVQDVCSAYYNQSININYSGMRQLLEYISTLILPQATIAVLSCLMQSGLQVSHVVHSTFASHAVRTILPPFATRSLRQQGGHSNSTHSAYALSSSETHYGVALQIPTSVSLQRFQEARFASSMWHHVLVEGCSSLSLDLSFYDATSGGGGSNDDSTLQSQQQEWTSFTLLRETTGHNDFLSPALESAMQWLILYYQKLQEDQQQQDNCVPYYYSGALVICPTGSGKSSLIQAASLLFPSRVSLVVVRTKALLQDFVSGQKDASAAIGWPTLSNSSQLMSTLLAPGLVSCPIR